MGPMCGGLKRSRAKAEGMENKGLSLCPRDTTPLTTVSSLRQETWGSVHL